jgi:hypothetical protein
MWVILKITANHFSEENIEEQREFWAAICQLVWIRKEDSSPSTLRLYTALWDTFLIGNITLFFYTVPGHISGGKCHPICGLLVLGQVRVLSGSPLSSRGAQSHPSGEPGLLPAIPRPHGEQHLSLLPWRWTRIATPRTDLDHPQA